MKRLLGLAIVTILSRGVYASNELSVAGGRAYSSASEENMGAFTVEAFHYFALDTFDLGVGAAYMHWGEKTGAFASTGAQKFQESYKPSALLLEGKGVVRLGKLSPYIVGGVGQVRQEFSLAGATFMDGSTSGKSSTLGIMGGIGVQCNVAGALFVGAEFRDVYIPSTSVGGADVPSSSITNLLLRVGVRI